MGNTITYPPVCITEHAKERARERLKWNAETLEKMSERAMNIGVKHSDTRGKLNRFMSKIYLQHKTANNTRIYGEHIYIFADNVLITVIQLPTVLKKYIPK